MLLHPTFISIKLEALYIRKTRFVPMPIVQISTRLTSHQSYNHGLAFKRDSF